MGGGILSDGQFLTSACEDNQVRLWNSHTGKSTLLLNPRHDFQTVFPELSRFQLVSPAVQGDRRASRSSPQYIHFSVQPPSRVVYQHPAGEIGGPSTLCGHSGEPARGRPRIRESYSPWARPRVNSLEPLMGLFCRS